MATKTYRYPDLATLQQGLAAVFDRNGGSWRAPIIVHRKSTYSSTFPCEVLVCRFDDGKVRELFCRYSGGVNYTAHGHRGMLEYESRIYRDLLSRLNLSVPQYYGKHTTAEGTHCIFLENICDSVRVGKLTASVGVLPASRWIAEFHRLHEHSLPSEARPWLKFYDANYYDGWVSRTLDYADDLHAAFPWLRPLCRRVRDRIVLLSKTKRTLIHGEYYPKNILVRDGVVYPVDWETAASANGLIDLACLTQNWGEEVITRCLDEYCQHRWSGDVPADTRASFDAARLYMCVRWLGDSRESTNSARGSGYLGLLRNLGEELGLI